MTSASSFLSEYMISLCHVVVKDDLYCNDELGLLLELPNAGNLVIDDIDYISKEIKLSDPNDCLPQRLLTLNLTTTPFKGVSQSKDYVVYTCSINGQQFEVYDEEIDCLIGSDYIVTGDSTGGSSSNRVIDPNCLFLKYMSVPTIYDDVDRISVSNYSSIYLTWDGQGCESCDKPSRQSHNDPGAAWKVVLGVIVSIAVLLLIICYGILRDTPPTHEFDTARDLNDTSAHTTTSSAPTSLGLDQITIDSYPTVTPGNGADPSKFDYNMCPICLSDYSPEDTLKVLPNCLHRFHADCIDVWLKSKLTCPICRTSPSHKLNNVSI